MSISDIEYRQNLFNLECKYTIDTSIKPKLYKGSVRFELIEYIMEMCAEFVLTRETFHLTVQYINHFVYRCSEDSISTNNLQCIGLACLFTASKMEQVYDSMSVDDLVFASDYTYTKQQILLQERKILNVLSYQLQYPTPYAWIMHFLDILDLTTDKGLIEKCMKILDGLACHEISIWYTSSALAAATLYTIYNGQGISIEECTGYRKQDFIELYPSLKLLYKNLSKNVSFPDMSKEDFKVHCEKYKLEANQFYHLQIAYNNLKANTTPAFAKLIQIVKQKKAKSIVPSKIVSKLNNPFFLLPFVSSPNELVQPANWDAPTPDTSTTTTPIMTECKKLTNRVESADLPLAIELEIDNLSNSSINRFDFEFKPDFCSQESNQDNQDYSYESDLAPMVVDG